MSDMAIARADLVLPKGPMAFLLRSCKSISSRRVGVVAVVALVMALVGAPQLAEMAKQTGWQIGTLIGHVLNYFVAALIVFFGWVLADAGNERWGSRNTRLAVALLVASLVSAIATNLIWRLSGGAAGEAHYFIAKGIPVPPLPAMLVVDYINTLLLGGVMIALTEAYVRRRLTQKRLEDAICAQAEMSREVLESRLAAMQAQVEPHFLFESLVDIESLYERDPTLASDILDHLIAYLRAALPRLREVGSTIGAEIELVDAYLSVVTAMHDGRPRFVCDVDASCRAARFYPMLLLPLIQRAVRTSDIPPLSIRLTVQRAGHEALVALRVEGSAPCATDTELQPVRERLQGLYAGRGTLDCAVLGASATQLTLRFPIEELSA